jgi:uncharacterized membrane-anchored protein
MGDRFSLSAAGGVALPTMLPPNHPLRGELNDEVHARPSDSLRAPLRVSYLALLTRPEARAEEWLQVGELLQRFGRQPPASSLTHYSADLGPFSLRFERHTEFTRYTITVPGPFDDPFAVPALAAVPAEWVAKLKGEVIVASHGALLSTPPHVPPEALAVRYFDGNVLVGSSVGDDAALALTDFRVRTDGFSRFLILDQMMTPRQAGRLVQRILEIDTYRMMALLALPVARALTPLLADYERELSQVTTVLESADADDEATLLDRLTRLEAHIESREAENHYRFSAADAYYELVQRRIAELREIRIKGLQTFGDFTERRLAPAMNTCRAVSKRQESLSAHVARANQLLATRVDITRERQNQALLESMNRRAKAQFKLQQTVEGLSIAAITYYVVGLIGYIAKGLKAMGFHVDYELIQAVSIPVVIVLTAFGIHHVRQAVTRTVKVNRVK